VRTSVGLQKLSSILMKFGMYIEVDEWCTMVCSMTRSKVKVKVTSPSELEIRPFSKAIFSAIYNRSWQVNNWRFCWSHCRLDRNLCAKTLTILFACYLLCSWVAFLNLFLRLFFLHSCLRSWTNWLCIFLLVLQSW